MSITIKDEAGIAGMREACRLASEVLDYLTPFIPRVPHLERGARQPQGHPP